ncbi:hypothetical protein [Agathobaculum sp. Marseille-P7918]|uniref:hypothetical protein n=1 Tax=Agathobaculum sp. Marseille-P7918 TaxID=2479843 RepID=UPI003562EB0E
MVSKTYQCSCPLSKKPVSVRVDYEKIEVCGDTGTYYSKDGYSCSAGALGDCPGASQENFECPVYQKSVY